MVQAYMNFRLNTPNAKSSQTWLQTYFRILWYNFHIYLENRHDQPFREIVDMAVRWSITTYITW
jgi:hypothetical protein